MMLMLRYDRENKRVEKELMKMVENTSVEFLADGAVKLSGGQILRNVHDEGTCHDDFCPIHNPSDHDMKDYPLFFNEVNMVRLMENGIFLPDPDDYLYNTGNPVIIRNSAKCLNCDSTIVSERQHDYKKCDCGNIFVDGGYSYLRHGYKNVDQYSDMSLTVIK